MAFTVSKATWLKTEGDRVAAILVLPKFWGRVWDHASLHQALAEIGLVYTREQILLLNDEMHARGIVEDVPDE